MEGADKELLELAAKAAGIERGESRFDSGVSTTEADGRHRHLPRWNPLEDDGDALRLAVGLKLQVTPGTYRNNEAIAFHAGAGEAHEHVHYQQDIYAATRRAIVRAAAEIARTQEQQK